MYAISKRVYSSKKRERRSPVIGAKAFQFKLASVLQVRIRQLEAVQQQFALQQQAVVAVQTLIDETQAEIKALLIPRLEETADAVFAQQRFGYIQHLKRQVEHLQQKLAEENRKLEIIREELRQAHVKKKTLERLEEKQYTAYLTEMAKQEEKETEDLVVARMATVPGGL